MVIYILLFLVFAYHCRPLLRKVGRMITGALVGFVAGVFHCIVKFLLWDLDACTPVILGWVVAMAIFFQIITWLEFRTVKPKRKTKYNYKMKLPRTR